MCIRFILAVLLFVSTVFAEDAMDLAEQPICVIGEVAPCGFVNNTVNVVEGNLYLRMHHLASGGQLPLDLVQYYNSQSNYTSWFGTGMSLNYSFWMQGREDAQKTRDKHGKYEALHAEAPGGSIHSCIAKGIDFGTTSSTSLSQDYYIDPKVIHESFTNCGSGHISARTNVKNIRLREEIKGDNDEYKWTAYFPDGTVKKYKRAEEKEDAVNVKKERRPNNTSLHYKYHKRTTAHPPIKRIVAKARSTMNWLKFERNHEDRKATVTAANGKRVDFHGFKKDDRYYIDKIESSDNPTQKFEYTKAGKYYSIERVVWPEGRFLEMLYDNKGRVTSQKAPVGKNDEKRTIWHFDYHSDHTDVKDANDHKTVYRHKNSRITSIEEFKDNKLYRAKAYYWGEKEGHSWGKLPKSDEGNLMAYATLNNEKCGVSLCYYDYDNYGNILKETLCGNLTGKYPWAFWIDDKGKPKDEHVEKYHKYYKYSKNHLLIHQSEDNGPSIEYRYKYGTDLMWAKFVRDGDKIIQREFYEYDHDGSLVEKIVDDGDSDNKTWLSGVTMRLVTYVEPVRGKEGYGQGLPQEVWENYLDLGTQKLVLLQHTHYDYNKAGKVTCKAVYDANNAHCHSTLYEYDSKSRLHKMTNPLGQVFTYTYDANDNKVYEKQEDTDFHTIYEYDKANRCQAAIEYHYDNTEVRTSYDYDFMGNKIASTDRYGHTTHYEYDDFNRLTKTTLPIERYTIQTKYDIFNNIRSETNAKGTCTKYEYTIRQQPYLVTYADNSQERFQYNKNGTLHKKWDKSNVETLYKYDTLGRVIKTVVTDPNGTVLAETSNTYNSFHLLSTTDPKGNTTYYRYDGAGRKIEELLESDNNYSKTTFEYDSLGRLYRIKNFYDKNRSKYSSSRFTYDKLDRLTLEKQQNSAGKCTSWTYYEYDAQGRCTLTRTSHTEEDAEVKNRYNSKGELVEVTDEYGNKTSITYNHEFINELGKKTLQKITTDALQTTTEEYFDILGRLVSVVKKSAQNQLLAATSYRYNATGQKIRQVERVVVDGKVDHNYVMSWKYDAQDRLIRASEQHHSQDEKVTLYTYDSFGRLQQIIKPDGVVLEHTYDALGRLSTLISSDNTISYTYSYDRNSNPRKVVDGISGLVTKRTYDAWNRITKDGIKNCSCHFSYDAVGRLSEMTIPDGSSVRYEYSDTHLKKVERYSPENTLLYEHRYSSFDLQNRPVSSKLIKDLGRARFTWDKKGRTTKIKADHYRHKIPKDGFDAVGNLKTYSFTDHLGDATVTHLYDDLYQLKQESGIQNHSYCHDSIHNRLVKDDANYAIDAQNKVVDDGTSQFTYDKNGNPIEQKTGDVVVRYSYDALDRLTQVTKGDTTTRYVYDSFNRRIARNSEHFFYLGAREVGMMLDGVIKEFRVLGLGKGAELGASVALELDGKLYCPLHDFRGNIVCLVDALTGEPTESYRYTAFGECEATSHTPEAPFNPWRFASKRFDPETGFTYFSRRYYCPTLGRWTTPDPIGFADGPNRYAYVRNSPLTLFDLYGLFAEDNPERAERVFTKNGNQVCFEARISRESESHDVPAFNKNFFSSKSKWIPIDGYEILNGGIISPNGIWNSEKAALDNFKYLSNLGDGVKLDGLYNATHGLLDVVEAFLQTKLSVYSAPSRMMAAKLNEEYLKNPAAVHLVPSFSQGAAVVKHALEMCDPEIRQQVISVAFGPALCIPSNLCRESYNYVSRRDYVPFMGDLTGLHTNRDCVYYLDPHPDANQYFDHSFQSPTYRKPMQDHLQKYIREHGIKR